MVDMEHALRKLEAAPYDALVVSVEALSRCGDGGPGLLGGVLERHPATQVLVLADGDSGAVAGTLPRAANLTVAPSASEGPVLKDAVAGLCRRARPQVTGAQDSDPVTETAIGRSRCMERVYRQLKQAAATEIPVLLVGETGTGKDLAAETIHRSSRRGAGPFVPVHLGALPSELVADELFGHEAGAFTGADAAQEGRFEQARNGTIFLDEIGTLDERVQIALLRIIEKKQFRRLGGRKTSRTNARVIAATNSDLLKDVEQGTFREDLYYRLDVFTVSLPPLRERHGDIPLLIDAFLKRYNRVFNKSISGISPECVAQLEGYDWPGNVRELKNVIQRAVLVCQGEVIMPSHLPPRFSDVVGETQSVAFDVGTPLAEVERAMIAQTLAATGNNRTKAADLLGISRRALYNKIARFGL